MTNILNIGKSALVSAQVGIDVTGHNIANASTPGYSRQVLAQAAFAGQSMGYGFIGKGTEVVGVNRVYNTFLGTHLRTTQSQFSQLNAYYTQIQQIDNILADTTVGLSPSLQSFFTSIQDLAANASSAVARQSLISSSQTMVSTFHSLSQQFSEMSQGLNSQITGSITNINSYAKQIAQLNNSIEKVMGSVAGAVPNDLFDQRDQLVAELSKEVGVSIVKDGNSYDVYIGNGQPMVIGGNSYSLVPTASDTDSSQLVIAYQNQNGSLSVMNEDGISGGALSGLLKFRSETLNVAQNSLGRIATVLASAFNEQHSLGQDLNGSMGTEFVGVYATNNAANATLSPIVVDKNAFLENSAQGYRLSYNGTDYTLTRLAENPADDLDLFTGTLEGAQAAANAQGFVFSLSGTVDAGESFAITPSYGTNFFNVASPLITPNSSNTSTATLSGAIGDATLLTSSDYSLSYDGTRYTLIRLADSVELSSTTLAAAQTAAASQGFSFIVDGSMAAGDRFAIRPTALGASDIRVAITEAAKIAAAAPIIASASSSNTGTGTVTAGTVNKPMTVSQAALRETITISFNANGTYDVLDSGNAVIGDDLTYVPGEDISYNGWTIQISGSPAVNDTFTIAANTSGVGDNRNALLLSALQTTNLVAGGTSTLQTAYSQLVNQIGNKTAELSVTSASAKTVYNNAYASQQAESGVNLDEEAANLLRYQQAYQAAAQVMKIANDLFDSLLSINA